MQKKKIQIKTYRNISSFSSGFVPMHIVHFIDDGKFSYVQYSHDHFSVSSSFSLFAFNDSLMLCFVQRKLFVDYLCVYVCLSVCLRIPLITRNSQFSHKYLKLSTTTTFVILFCIVRLAVIVFVF